jgi:hypothetical protein
VSAYEVKTITVDGRTTALGSAGPLTLVVDRRSKQAAPGRASMVGSC